MAIDIRPSKPWVGGSNPSWITMKEEAGTKPPSQTKKGLEFEFFLKFQSFYFA